MPSDRNFEADKASLGPKTDFSRRSMMVTTLATGFAAAVQPVAAQTTITTDSTGIDAGEIKIKTASGDIPGYRAMPKTGSNLPTIIVVQEIFGVHEHIKDVCRRLAKLGYFAIAPEMYARQGDVSKLKSMDEIRPIVAKVPDAQVMADLDAAVDFAKASGRANAAKLGITGFCWGGRVVWLYSAHNKNLKAGVAWYGRVVGDKTEMTPSHPIDLAANLNAPVLGLYGGADAGIPVDSLDKIKAACAAAKKSCEITVYPDTPHAFHADYRPSYREGPAKDGWAKMIAFFKQRGVA
ncbi:MAG: dienelactone hydrolase family protein [Hyphomicrobiaceae bacterium]